MTEFTYNNVKNANTDHILFELNCGFYLRVLFQEDVNPYSRFRLANKLVNKLWKLIKICY